MSSCVAILILDDDLGFAMWLGRILNDAGMQSFPASRSNEALVFLHTVNLPRIDLLIANFELAGSREVVEALATQSGKLRLIGIGDKGSAGRRKIGARLHRPKGSTNPSADPYVEIVRGVLAA